MNYLNHRRELKNGKPKEEKKRKPIAKMSAKRKADQVKYRKIVKEAMLISDRCEIKSKECTGKAEGMQHKKRRGKNFLDRSLMLRACNACNSYCERFPVWAIENGFAISTHKK